jgi:hypothetical protein
MKPFNPTDYSQAIAPLLSPMPLPALGPGSPHEAVRSALAALTPESVCPKFVDRDMALACLSGLWLLHDFLDESHKISQDLESTTGCYWHGIMHRREPDVSNSKYWFQKIGRHPVVDLLVTEAPKIGHAYRNPAEFVDFCERVRGTGSADEELARRVQLVEWQLLFGWCWYRAKPVWRNRFRASQKQFSNMPQFSA